MTLTLLLPYDPLPPAPAYTVRVLRRFGITAYDLLEAALALWAASCEPSDSADRLLYILDHFKRRLPEHLSFEAGLEIAEAIDKALTPVQVSLLPVVIEHIEKTFGFRDLRYHVADHLFPDYVVEIDLTEPIHEDTPAVADHSANR